MNSANGSASKNLDEQQQAAIRARLLGTLNASRLKPEGAAASEPAPSAPETERLVRQEAQLLQLTTALDASQARVAELESRLAAEGEAQTTLRQEKARADEQLAVAVRRLEGLTAEVAAQCLKVQAFEFLLKRITSHKLYRLWDRWRAITGKPSLHGVRQDPLGIKPGMPN